MTSMEKCFLSASDVTGRHDYDVNGEVFSICQSEVTGRPVRILTVHACTGEANIIKMDVSSWFHPSLRLFLRGTASATHIVYMAFSASKRKGKKKKKSCIWLYMNTSVCVSISLGVCCSFACLSGIGWVWGLQFVRC